jgi:sodium transport system permease protein
MTVQPYRPRFGGAWLAVLMKEVKDIFRDKRTLQMALFLSLVQGPLVLFLVSTLAQEREERANKREIYVQGIEAAPTLRNYLERQSYTIKTPHADFEAQLKANAFDDAVLKVPQDFEERLARGEAPELELVYDSNSRGSETAQGVASGLISGFTRERAVLGLALMGVAPDAVRSVEVQERDLASASSRSAKLTGALIPFYVLVAVLTGAMSAAMDTTAGERERSSLEPLMMNPASTWALALGKWVAVSLLGVLVATLTSLSYVPAQMLFKSEALQALFQFSWGHALAFGLIAIPFAMAVAALMMAVSIRAKSVKEAQVGSSVVMMVLMALPLVAIMNDSGEPPWYLWVPSLSQQTLMMRLLKSEPFELMHWVVPAGVCLGLALLGLAYVSRALRTNAVR